MARPTRRSLLGLGALAGVAGVVGGPATPASAAPSGRTFTLHGRQLRRLTGAGRPKIGDAHSVRGVLADTATGAAHGEVFHSGHTVTRAGGGHPDEIAAVEQHLLVLPLGTLAGSGTVTHAGRGTFVVSGGTGSYAGARGSYTTDQTADTVGGGVAVYRFVLTTEN